jgi:hypothetical protein
MTTEDILTALDNCYQNKSFSFITLEHPYIYTIDSRLDIFRGDNYRWAIVSEVLGYNPRGGAISIEIKYFGNCLINLEGNGDLLYNYYLVYPIDDNNFNASTEGEAILPDANFWLVRGEEVKLLHDSKNYINAGIELSEYEPGEIRIEEAARLSVPKYQDFFRATDNELFKSIPTNLRKILVIDEWYHKEFSQIDSPLEIVDIQSVFNNANQEMKAAMQAQLENNKKWNTEMWENRPSSYETWQQIAEVIVTSDPSKYKPTLKPNSHWNNWPEAGAL